MKKLLILLAGIAIIAMVAVPAIIMQPEDRINPAAQSVNAVGGVNATAVLPQATAAPTQTPDASEPGITYELEVDTAKITLTLPSEYEMLPMGQDYGDIPVYDRYVFLNSSTGVSFWVEWYSLDTENQSLLMRKMRDARGMVILDNMTFGAYQGTVRYQTDYNYDHHFLILGDNGYAYQFLMRLPEDQGQNSPPEEALKILETVCLSSKLNTKQHIEINLDMDELDLTDAEKKATYQEIKDYVLEHSGLKVSSLYIAQVKQQCGIIERENYNKPKAEDAKQPQCPPDKEKAIKGALKFLGMV